MVKNAYGDLFARVRQRQPMSLPAQIAWNLLPPLTFGTDRLVISWVLAPAYDVGGDCFDHAVDASTARVAVFDAMGHGLAASWLATVAIGAYRNARQAMSDLPGTVAAVRLSERGPRPGAPGRVRPDSVTGRTSQFCPVPAAAARPARELRAGGPRCRPGPGRG